MKLTEKFSNKVAGCTNALVQRIVEQNANSACIWLVHQPEFPKEAEKYKKVK